MGQVGGRRSRGALREELRKETIWERKGEPSLKKAGLIKN